MEKEGKGEYGEGTGRQKCMSGIKLLNSRNKNSLFSEEVYKKLILKIERLRKGNRRIMKKRRPNIQKIEPQSLIKVQYSLDDDIVLVENIQPVSESSSHIQNENHNQNTNPNASQCGPPPASRVCFLFNLIFQQF